MITRTGTSVASHARIESNSSIECDVVAGEVEFTFAGGALELTFTRRALEKLISEARWALSATAARATTR
ncbi:hypothetical protein AB0I60_35210 [Actinosynnema sp. NPDC050436]|uniref:hypothetical protein n=1 Tax=Actinosynnema sp. NPDC050436 TaxID=3155659 RepID=UPI0033E6871E